MLTNAKQFFTWWTAELKTWFTTKFTPLATEENVNSKASGITTAISDMRGDSSTTLRSINQKVDSLATESNATANKNAILNAILSINIPTITYNAQQEAIIINTNANE